MATTIQVLCVDDDPDYLDLMQSYLESDGRSIEVTPVEDPDTCLRLLERKDFDCVVSDFQMPDKDGLELLEEVRDRRPELPYLLNTAEGTEDVASEAIASGVDDYVQKRWGPEGYEILAKRIKNAVAQNRAETAYQEVFENSAVGLTVHDPETGEVVASNERFNRMLGHPEGVKLSLEHLREENDVSAKEVVDAVTATAEDGARTVEWHLEGSDGEELWLEVDLRSAEINGVRRVLASARDVTEKKRQKQQLRRRTDLLDRTQEIANVGGWELDLETDELRWTKEVRRIKGYPPDEEPTVEEALETYHSEDREVLESAIDSAVEEDEPYDLELRIKRPDGEMRWVRTRGELQIEDGQRYLRGTIQDVSQRKRRERRYEAVFNNTLEYKTLLKPDGTLVEVNDTALAFGGLDRDTVKGMKIWNTPWAAGLPETEEAMKELLETASEGESLVTEFEVNGREGRRLVDCYVSPVSTRSGDVVLVVAEGRDVTQRRQRQKELEQTKKSLRSIFDGSPDSIYLHDEEGRFIDVNDTACRRLGYSRDELLDLGISDISPHDREEVVETFGDAEFTEQTIETEHIRKDGSTYPVQVNVTRVELEGQDQFVAVVRDITEVKETQRRLRKQRDRLEEFAEIVSHDLRNPLTVASGRLEMAKEESSSSHLEEVEDAHDRMEEMIEDMLDLAKQGERVQEFEEVDLERLARRSWANVATGEAELEVDDSIRFDADSDRFSRLLENLYANAYEHGSGSVEDLEVRVGSLMGSEKGFYVEDNGAGIPKDRRSQVFETGYTTSEEGTGLGLKVVEEIAEAHGWKVSVDESSEGGARFEITGVDQADEGM